MHSILIVDDQASVRESLKEWLGPTYRVETAESGEACLKRLEETTFDVVLLDERMPGMLGSEVLSRVAPRYPDTQVIMMTAFGSVDAAVEAIKRGAADYLLKPIELDALKLRIDKILGYRAIARENVQLRKQLEEKFSFHSILTRDATLKDTCERVRTVARSDAAVLITGDSGTGKELMARALHQASDRAGRPFVTLACGATPDTLIEAELFGHEKGSFTGAISDRAGKFEEAADGTLFLDEIGELSPTAQVKFLHVLQERNYQRIGGSTVHNLEARIVSATNRDLEEALETGHFRQDLFYRVNTVRIDIPPLRNRRGDVVLLADHFMVHFAGRYGRTEIKQIHPEAMRILQLHSWPGNVRELKGALEQSVILCKGETILPGDLPGYLTEQKTQMEARQTFHQLMDDHGRTIVLEALERGGGLKKDAARYLGLSQRALSHYLKKFGITS